MKLRLTGMIHDHLAFILKSDVSVRITVSISVRVGWGHLCFRDVVNAEIRMHPMEKRSLQVAQVILTVTNASISSETPSDGLWRVWMIRCG